MPVLPPRIRAKRRPTGARHIRIFVLTTGALIVLFAGYLMLTPQQPAPTPLAQDTPAAPAAPPVRPDERGEVVFAGRDGGRKAAVKVEIADDERSRELGLMYRRAMGREYGMLFIFDSAAVQSFWMKNTFLPLDMIFVDGEGTVVTIHRNTTPRSLQSYASTAPSLYVVEVNAGFSDAHGLLVGDRMHWRRDTTDAAGRERRTP